MNDDGEMMRLPELIVFARQHGLKIKVMRIFNTYGPRMDPNDGRVVSNFIVQALRGENITIYGDGSQSRSFCYVDDLIEGMIRLMNSAADITGPINVGNPGEFSMLELATAIVEATGSSSTIEFQPLPADDPRQRQPDITKAKSILGWEPTIDLAEGLERTIGYFRRELARPQS
jgi:UDP-glucuronate decarboxylase